MLRDVFVVMILSYKARPAVDHESACRSDETLYPSRAQVDLVSCFFLPTLDLYCEQLCIEV